MSVISRANVFRFAALVGDPAVDLDLKPFEFAPTAGWPASSSTSTTTSTACSMRTG